MSRSPAPVPHHGDDQEGDPAELILLKLPGVAGVLTGHAVMRWPAAYRQLGVEP